MNLYRLILILCLGLNTSVQAQQLLPSSVYEYEKIPASKIPAGETRLILKSATRSLEMFEINELTLIPYTNVAYQSMDGSDELIIVKAGKLDININNEEKRQLGEGSIIVLSSGDRISLTNGQAKNTLFFSLRFKPVKGGNEPGITHPPIIADWKKLEFVKSKNGGRRNLMQQRTTSLKELEIHVTTLNEGLPSHAAHVHADEEIILVKKGYVEETIKGETFRLGPGSVIFLTNDDLHGIGNAGKGQCEYYAIRWLVN